MAQKLTVAHPNVAPSTLGWGLWIWGYQRNDSSSPSIVSFSLGLESDFSAGTHVPRSAAVTKLEKRDVNIGQPSVDDLHLIILRML